MTTPQRQPPTGRNAVLHRAGGAWRVVIADLKPASAGKPAAASPPAAALGAAGGGATILDARTVEPAEIESHLDAQGATAVICVLPAGSFVCRTTTLPAADHEQLDQALRLQAEAHLLGNAPAHRTALAVLPAAPGETSRTGIILSWPEAALFEAPRVGDRPVTFAPDVGALAALLGALRPAEALLCVDRASGSVAFGLAHANGAVFRATREDASDAPKWAKAVTRAIAETALAAGHSGTYVDHVTRREASRLESMEQGDSLVSLPREVIDFATARLPGLSGAFTDGSDANEAWSKYGIAAGVLLAATSELADFTTFRAVADIETPTVGRRLVAMFSRPKTALVTVAICLCVLALAPLIAAAARLTILELRHAEVATKEREVIAVQNKLAIYDALGDRAWSMTKVISDIVSAVPPGIELDTLRVQTADESFAVTGEALPRDGHSRQELIVLMTERLVESGMFEEITPRWGDAGNIAPLSFELTAKITRPHAPREYPVEWDFAKWTLSARLYGGPRPGEEGAAAIDAGSETPVVATIDDAGESAGADDATGSSGIDGTRSADGAAFEAGALASAAPDGSDAGASARTPGAARSTDKDPARARPGEPDASPSDGRATVPVAPATGAEGGRGGPRIPRPNASGGEGGEIVATRSEPGSRGDKGLDPSEIPPPLTIEQVKAMTKDEALAHLIKVANASQKARKTDDAALVERLKQERQWLLDRRKEAEP